MTKCIYILSLLIGISSCTTAVKIEYSDTTFSALLSDDLHMVGVMNNTDSDFYRVLKNTKGYYLVKLKSESDMENIVLGKEMAFLYYRLYTCSSGTSGPELYSAPVLKKIDEVSSNVIGFEYYAPVPTNYVDLIEGDGFWGSGGKLDASSEICINLGAGNMAGQKLTTNLVKFPKIKDADSIISN